MTNGGVQVRAEIPGAPAAVRSARRLVTTTLEQWGLPHLVEYAALLVSEVVTNAVLHARSDVEVELRWGSEPAELPFRKAVWFELPVDPARLAAAAEA